MLAKFRHLLRFVECLPHIVLCGWQSAEHAIWRRSSRWFPSQISHFFTLSSGNWNLTGEPKLHVLNRSLSASGVFHLERMRFQLLFNGSACFFEAKLEK
jgi:hypothetical protein